MTLTTLPRQMGTKTILAFLNAIKEMLTAEMMHTHVDGCIGCGNCGAACAYFLTGQAPHPLERAEALRDILRRYFTPLGQLLLKLGLAKPLTEAELWDLSDTIYGCCTMCSRCSLACPHGVSNGQLTAMAKHALARAEIVPPLIEQIASNSQTFGNSYGMSFNDTMGEAIRIAESIGTCIPLDIKGADYLLNCSAILMNGDQRLLANAAELLESAGYRFTASSKLTDSGTEAMTTVSNQKLGATFIEAAAQEAKRLGCKYLIVGECGCDIATYFVTHAYILEHYGVQPVLLDTLLLNAIKDERLRINRLQVTATYHDPCWMARKAGFFAEPRELLHILVQKVIELKPNREMQICCGGGSGMLRKYPSNQSGTNPRREAGRIKAEQLVTARCQGATICATPCTTCLRNIRDLTKHYKINLGAETLMALTHRAWQLACSPKGDTR